MAVELLTISVYEHGPSDCSPRTVTNLVREGDKYFAVSLRCGEEGSYESGREPLSHKEADQIIAQHARKECAICYRDISGNARDYSQPNKCHICAGIEYEDRFPGAEF